MKEELFYRATPGSSGYDIRADERTAIQPGQVAMVATGVHIQLPDASWEAQVRPRSGMSLRGLIVILGTIDSDYRGPIGVIIHNTTKEIQVIELGTRIAQLVFNRVVHPEFVEVNELQSSERGEDGFGSTGE